MGKDHILDCNTSMTCTSYSGSHIVFLLSDSVVDINRAILDGSLGIKCFLYLNLRRICIICYILHGYFVFIASDVV